LLVLLCAVYNEVTQYIGAGADANAFAGDLMRVMSSVYATFIGNSQIMLMNPLCF
jgi:hypothetical protein